MSSRDVGIVVLVVIGVLVLLPLLGGVAMMGGGIVGPGMMGGWGFGAPWSGDRWGGGWGMPFFGMIFWVLILVGIVLVINSLVRRNGAPAGPGVAEAPLEILKRRLAKGEITRDEYEALKKELA